MSLGVQNIRLPGPTAPGGPHDARVQRPRRVQERRHQRLRRGVPAIRAAGAEGASGFVRAGGPLDGKVSLVIGGGSGHYPSYNGVVGTGFADGAVLGDLFASPSAEQVYRVARAANGGAGVVLGFGNYAGDRLNFGVAAERLIAEGIDTRIVYVTDDIASASRRSSRSGAASPAPSPSTRWRRRPRRPARTSTRSSG